MKRYIEPFILAAATLSLFSSCASFTYQDRHQDLLVRSNPEGAQIKVDGELVGMTPDIVEFRRSKAPTYDLVTSAEIKTIKVEKTYDWGGSFARNFIFLDFAPFGWLVDWATGSAWKLKNPPVTKLESFNKVGEPKPQNLAIAPPSAETLELSDRAGQIWEQQLESKSKERKVVKYQESLHAFSYHHFDFDEVPSLSDRYRLYHDLGLTQIFESRVVEDENGDIILRGHIYDIYSDKSLPEQTVHISREDLKEIEVETWSRKTGWIHVIPNTFGIDFSSSDTEIDTADNLKHAASPAAGASDLDKIFYYVGAIDITRQNPPRQDGPSRWRFQIVPNIFALNKQLSFPDLYQISTVEFHYLQLAAGLGAETGWQKGRHYAYFNLIPMFGYQHLSWQQDGEKQSLSLGGLELRLEIGYRYYVTKHWSGKIFVKSTQSYSSLWDSAIHRLDPNIPQITNAIDTSAGFAVSYTFDMSPDIHFKKANPTATLDDR